MTDKIQSAEFNKALAQLNAAQLEAVNQIDGPVLVIAGPGTGKTQIIAARIGNILTQTDTAPQNILCLTYTDAGTIAMRQRLLKFIGPTAYRVNIYTFHAFCNEVIQSNLDYFGKRILEPISDLENIDLLQSIIDELPPSNPIRRLKGDIYFEVKRLNALFKMMKDEDWTTEKVLKAIDVYLTEIPLRNEFQYQRDNGPKGIKKGDPKQSAIDDEKKKMDTLRAAAELFPVYQKKMLALNRYDYSDMILWVVKAFSENENMLRNYQERYLYFLVDEFQDTNGSQNEILKLLTNYWDKPNCFTVGDDDQSIYEFQGARVKNIMDFYESNRDEIKSIVLTENYRSNQKILDAAKVLIDHNEERLIHKIPDLDKTLTASHPAMMKSGVTPEIISYPNIAQEEAGIVMQVEALMEQGFPLSDIAVIYHRHAQAENVIQLFEKKNIPYSVRKKINILVLPLIQNILTTLKYLDEEMRRPHSGEYLLFELMHFHFFHIHPHDVSAVAAFAGGKRINNKWREILADHNSLSQIRLKDPDALTRFEKNITNWLKNAGNLTLQMLFEEILNDSGLLTYILKSDEKIWLMQVLTTFFDFLKAESAKQPRIKVRQFLEMIEQMEDHELGLPVNKTVFREDGVNFITAHSAKGLEFQHVFMLGCTADKWEGAAGGGSNFSLPDTLTHTKNE
ncbi:MAG: ATP-dependent helicase, partial [Bacteroidota bacterium]